MGLFFRDFLNNESRELALIGFSFIFSGIIICLHLFKKFNISFFYIVVIASLFQAFAALPGVSRSGMVIGISVLLGLGLRKSIILSFLMSIPLIFISSFYEIVNLFFDGFLQFDIFNLLAGFIFSFLASFFGIKIMIYLSNFIQLRIFGVYNILLGAFILIFSIL
ncbi:MAG: undecaprenyl-diphosphate phosphatase [Dehalococcoidia bacterium]